MPSYFPITLQNSDVTPSKAAGSSTAPTQPVSVSKQKNLWGKSIDPHRVDLWYVSLEEARAGLQATTGAEGTEYLPEILPQHIQSVTLPEPVKIRAEAVRRESIAYQMPSWDEPLDPVSVTFILEDTTPNPVLTLLETWASLVRAGRGMRSDSGGFRGQSLKLNDRFGIDFRFNIYIYLLQGSTGRIQINTNAALATAAQSQIKRKALAQMGDALKKEASAWGDFFSKKKPLAPSPPTAPLRAPDADEYCVLNVVKTWMARVWLSGYKVNELSYNNNGMVTVTATFQTEFLNMQSDT